MSKTFKSIAPGSNSTIEIAGTDGNVTVYVHQNIGAIDLSATDAPALALAILEAAVGGHSEIAADLADAMSSLRREVRRVEEWAKAAADREALEVEARGLRAAHSLDETQMAWEHLAPLTRKRWEKAALKARELHGSTK